MFIRGIAVSIAISLLAGCSEIEPKTGTRVVFTIRSARPIGREKTAELSRYLITRSEAILRVDKPRVECVEPRSITLLLPGHRVPREKVELLIESASLELYHLKTVATRKHPDRSWKLKLPKAPGAPYIFTGPDARRIESVRDKQDLLTEIVGFPRERPILTGKDVLPNAGYQEIKRGWAVLVRFNKTGSAKFREFTETNSGEYLAVFCNGRLMSAAIVEGPIESKEVFLTGFGSLDEARAVVGQINSGVLPAPVTIESVGYYR